MSSPYRTSARVRPSWLARLLCRVLGHRWVPEFLPAYECRRCRARGVEHYTPPYFWRIEVQP